MLILVTIRISMSTYVLCYVACPLAAFGGSIHPCFIDFYYCTHSHIFLPIAVILKCSRCHLKRSYALVRQCILWYTWFTWSAKCSEKRQFKTSISDLIGLVTPMQTIYYTHTCTWTKGYSITVCIALYSLVCNPYAK